MKVQTLACLCLPPALINRYQISIVYSFNLMTDECVITQWLYQEETVCEIDEYIDNLG